MEFEGQYLTYQEYTSLGGTLDQTPFNLLEFEARNKVDLRTQNRLVGVEEIPFKVKMCMYNLIEKMNSYINEIDKINENGNISSENIDGYSVSYVSATQIKDIIASNNAELDNILLEGLYGVIVNDEHIIYNGVK
jgi:hypothetical protein